MIRQITTCRGRCSRPSLESAQLSAPSRCLVNKTYGEQNNVIGVSVSDMMHPGVPIPGVGDKDGKEVEGGSVRTMCL
jgi:hypothetical protein